MTLGEIAQKCDCVLNGDPEIEVRSAASIDNAGPQDIVFAVDYRHLHNAEESAAGAVLTSMRERECAKPTLRSTNVRLAWAKIVELLYPQKTPVGGTAAGAVIDPTAAVAQSASVGPHCTVAAGASIGERCVLGPGVVIGEGAVVGDDSILHAHVVIGSRCVIGRRNILFAGAVIGADGFGFARDGERFQRVPQVGIVRLGDDVEIGANSAIDRAALDETVIEDGVKIDNLVQVGHNTRIGANTVIAAQVGISGSVTVEPSVTFAGQSGVSDHCTVGKGAVLTATACLIRDAEPGAILSGYPARPHRTFLRAMAALHDLPAFVKRVEKFMAKQEGPEASENVQRGTEPVE